VAQPSSHFWAVFSSTFLTIFLAELGDKTQVTILLMSAQSQSPLVVFLGAGLALIATSLAGVLLGQWLAKRVSPDTLDTCAGILLLLITIGLVGDIVGR
jgi:putative Ca2+/H+ antiporter (TMEM165/GDT1 family)